ncbi:MAG: hypothetical protein COV67_06825 [Nitrospinae bacterium CG11_big_fil_rev_8_21_14_0_20_56_8]|nr:MAG: hypothetical protein COV67_06825 [Nitrospinae bacterium CG11_big_fil_rev_8_21_14_0_20_56_8]
MEPGTWQRVTPAYFLAIPGQNLPPKNSTEYFDPYPRPYEKEVCLGFSSAFGRRSQDQANSGIESG